MDQIVTFFQSIGLDFHKVLPAALILLLGVLALGLAIRFIFGKRSSIQITVTSAIGILFIYAVTIVLHSLGARFEAFVAPLPFISLQGDYLTVFSLKGSFYADICTQILSAVVLAFLMNVVDGWMPKGKKPFRWLLLRCASVTIAFFLHLGVTWLFTNFLPESLVTYAPTVLLALLVIMLLTGALKAIVGAILCITSPIIGGLYTFFFATVLGKQISRAMLTAAILTALVWALNTIGYTAVYIASAALIAYIPFLLILLALWFLVGYIL